MPNYGEAEYWDRRYESEKDSPFDWLFDYSELSPIIEYLLPDKDELALLIGCGNAPFSPDLCTIGGYRNVINTDLSTVVIHQQKNRFPDQKWKVLDALDMSEIPESSIPVVIDKSLIDTLLCCSNSEGQTSKMIDEVYRVLAPGSRFITFSLHAAHEVVSKYNKPHLYQWKVTYFRVKSNRWNESNNRKRAVSHTMIICDKPSRGEAGVQYRRPLALLEQRITGVLSEAEDAALKKKAEEVLFVYGLSRSPVDSILRSLLVALERYRHQQGASPSSFSEGMEVVAADDGGGDGSIVDAETENLNSIKAGPTKITEIRLSEDEPVGEDGGVTQPFQQKPNKKKHVGKKKNRQPASTPNQQRCE